MALLDQEAAARGLELEGDPMVAVIVNDGTDTRFLLGAQFVELVEAVGEEQREKDEISRRDRRSAIAPSV